MQKYRTIGDTLARKRRAMGHSVDCLSRMIEVSPEIIEQIESGGIKNRYTEVVSIALVLNVDLPMLFGTEPAADERAANRTFEIARSMSKLLAG